MSTATAPRPVETDDDEREVQFGRPRQRAIRENVTQYLLVAATLAGLVVLAILLVRIFQQGFSRIQIPEFLVNRPTVRTDPENSGIWPALSGTLSLMTIVALLSFPLGIGAALYLEEFAPKNIVTRLIETNIQNLAGVPSVVYGLLGLGAFVSFFDFGRSLIAGALTLVLLILPVIIVTSREAIKAVPRALREGGMGLGATKWQTTAKLVLPSALPGMFTGAILGLSRAIGEAAPILVVGAVTVSQNGTSPFDLFERFAAMPVSIFAQTIDPSEEVQTIAAASIIVLLGALLLMNSVAITLRNRFSK